MCVSCPNLCSSWRGIAVSGSAVFFGMVGCLVEVLLVSVLHGLILWVNLLIGPWRWCHVLTRLTALCFGDFWDAEWRDGSLELYPTADISVAGAGVYLPAPELVVQGAVWEEAEECGAAGLDRCRAFMPVPGPLQTVQCAETWALSWLCRRHWPGHLGIDNLHVVPSIGRLLDRGRPHQALASG